MNLPNSKNRLYSDQEAAEYLGVSSQTLRRWESRGILIPQRTKGNQRRYSHGQLQRFKARREEVKETPVITTPAVAPIQQSAKEVVGPFAVETVQVTAHHPPQQGFEELDTEVRVDEAVEEVKPSSSLYQSATKVIKFPSFFSRARVSSINIYKAGFSALVVFILLAGLSFLPLGHLPFFQSFEKEPVVRGGNVSDVLSSHNITDFTMVVNIPSRFTKNVKMTEGLDVDKLATFSGGIVTNNANGDFGTGIVIASNIPTIFVDSVVEGNGVTVDTADPRNPIISNNGVLSLQGQTGAVNFTAGSGISISGLTISSTISAPSASNSFANIAVSSQSTLSAGSPTDTLTFVAGSNVTLTTDTANKSLTINATSGTPTQWTTNGTDIYYDLGNVGIGVTTPLHQLELGTGTSEAEGIGFGVDVAVFRGAADRLDLASGDRLNLVAGSLEIGGTSVITATRLFQAADGSVLNPAFSFSSEDNTGIFRPGAGTLAFGTLGVERFRVDQAGNFGIGTTVPLAKLDVNGSASVSGNLTFGTSASIQTTAMQSLTIGGGSTGTIFFPSFQTCVLSTDASGALYCGSGGGGGGGITNIQENDANVVTSATIINFDGTDFTVTNPSVAKGSVVIDYGASGITRRNNAEIIGGQWSFLSDVLIGGISSNSARFAFLNAQGAGTPTASISGNIVLNSAGNLQTTSSQTLTIGGGSTGQVVLSGRNGSSTGITLSGYGTGVLQAAANGVISSAALNLAGGSNFVTGTLPVGNGGTGATSFTANGILFGNGSSAIQVTGAAANSILATNGSNVPGLTQTLPNAVQDNITRLGTIVSGVWNGTVIGSQYGGTGQDLSGATGVPYLSSGTWATEAQLAIARGGTNSTATPTQGGLAYGTGTAYAFTSAGNGGQCLISGGTGAPTWIDCGTASGDDWDLANGALYPKNSTVDLLIGGTSTASAKFAFINNSSGIPTASISGNIVLNSTGSLQTTNSRTLTVGGSTTGQVVLSGRNGSATGVTFAGYGIGLVQSDTNGILSSAALNLAGGSNYVTGVLPIANGGTNGSSTPTAGAVAYGTGTAYAFTSAGSVGQILQSNGTGTPTWIDAASLGTNYWNQVNGTLYPKIATVDLLIGGTSTASAVFHINATSGVITASTYNEGVAQFDTNGVLSSAALNLAGGSSYVTGTLPVGNGGTGATSFTANGILFGNGSSAIQVTAAAANSILATNGSNVPGLTQTLPSAVQDNITRLGTIVSGVWNGTVIGSQYGGTGQNFASSTGVPYISSGTWATEAQLAIARGGTNASTIGSAGSVAYSTGTAYAFSAVGTSGQCLVSGGTGSPTWIDCGSASDDDWDLVAGALYPKNSTVDLLIGGTSTASAKFAFINNNSGTPTASIAGNIVLNSVGSLQTTNGRTLTVGGSTTGQVVLSGRNGSSTGVTFAGYGIGLIQSDANGVLSSAALNLAGGSSYVTGVLPIANGGTNGSATPTAGAVAYGTGTAYAFSSAGTSGQCLISGGTGTPTWTDCGIASGDDWDLVSGVLYPKNTTVDVLIGGTSTASAKFAFINVNSGTPTASMAGNIVLAGGARTIQSASGNTLTLGGNTTGQVILSGRNANATGITFAGYTAGVLQPDANGVISSAALNLAGGSSYITGTLPVGNGGTGATTFTTNGILYGNGTSAIQVTGAAANSVLVTNGSNVPSLSTTLPNAVQDNITRLGTITSGVWNGTVIGSQYGGTGQDFSGSTGVPFISSGTWATEAQLAVARGGTNANTIGSAGTVAYSTGTAYAFSAVGTSGQCLVSGGTGAPTWTSCGAAAGDDWDLVAGALYPKNSTVDLLIGGTSTASAKFAVLNMNSGTPVASVAGNVVLSGGARSVQGTSGNTLTIGGNTTGQVVLSGRNGSSTGITLSGYAAGVLQPDANGVLTSAALNLAGGSNYVTGILPIANGGTNGSATPTAGAIAYGTGTAYAFTSAGSTGQCLISGGNGAPTWIDCGAASGDDWDLFNGALYPKNTTVDVLIGGTSTASAKFAFINVNSGTPTASIAGNIVLAGGARTLQTTAGNTLTIGGSTTGQVILSGRNANATGITFAGYGVGVLQSDANGVLSSAALNLAGGSNFVTGTLPVGNGGTGATSFTANGILYGNGSSAIQVTGAAANSVLVTNGSNVPSLATTLPNAVQDNITRLGTITSGVWNGTVIGSQYGGTGQNFSSSTGVPYISSGTWATEAQLAITRGGTNANTIGSAGSVAYSTGTAYAFTGVGGVGQVLTSDGAGTPVWSDAGGVGTNYWNQINGALSPKSLSADLLLGGSSTVSAKFAFINNASGTPTASIAGNIVLNSTGSLQTTAGQTLSLGGSTTGNIVLSPGNGSGTVAISSLSTGVVFNTNGVLTSEAQLAIVRGGTNANTLGSAGSIAYSNGTSYAFTGVGAAGQVLVSDGSGTPSWQDAGGVGINYWNQLNGALSPKSLSADLLLGGNSTASAKFAFINNGAGTPTASIAGNIVLNSAGTLQTTANQTLTFGGNTSGNIVLAPLNGIAGSNVSPNTNNQVDLGTTTQTFRNIYAGTDVRVGGVSVCLANGTNCPSGAVSYWNQTNGALYPVSNTVDVLVGGSSTASAKFGLINVNSGTPTASISANSGNNATFLSGLGVLGTTNGQTLSLGGSTTGQVVLSGRNGSSTGVTFAGYGIGLIQSDANGVLSSAALNLAGGASYITGTLPVGNGGTGATSFTTNGILFGNGSSAIQVTGAAANSILATNGSNVPALTQTLPNAVQDNITRLGTIVSGVWNGTVIGSQYGGTGQNFASSTGVPYISSGTWATEAQLAIARGGTNSTAIPTQGGLAYGTGTAYAFTSAGTSGQCIISAGTGAPTWSDCGTAAGDDWDLVAGALYPKNSTVDLLIGGTSTASAKFAFINVNAGTPTASIAGNVVLSGGARSIQGAAGNTLTIGGSTTGQIVLSGRNGSATGITLSGYGAGVLQPDANGVLSSVALNLAGGSSYITGVLPIANGGTNGSATPTAGAVAYGTGTAYAFTSAGSTGQCLISGGNGAPTWSDCGAASGDDWDLFNGALYPKNTTVDVLIGGTSTASAKFAFINNNSGTPTASIAGNVILAGGARSIQGASGNTLTLGGNTTGQIVLSGRNANATGITFAGYAAGVLQPDANGVISSAALNLAGGASYITGTLPVGNGGTGATSFTANGILFGNGSSAIQVTAAAANSVLVTNGSNVPSLATTLPNAVQDNITRLGTITSGVWNGTVIGSQYGGTGQDFSGTTGVPYISSGTWATEAQLAIARGGTNANTIGSAGSVAYSTGTAYAFSAVGTSGQCLVSGGTGAPAWTDCGAASGDDWNQLAGALYPKNSTVDLLIGGTSTASAKFAVLNMNSGTPVASVAGNVVLSGGARTIQGTAGNTLTIGGSTTGQIVLSGRNGAANGITLSGYAAGVLQPDANGVLTSAALNLAGGASYVTGVLPIANGGTNGSATPTAGAVAYGTGTAYAFTSAGSTGQCLISGGTGTPTWSDCGAASGDDWDLFNGALYPKNTTVDVLIGGTSTASAKFAFINVNTGTPTASIAGNVILAGGARSIQGASGNTLTLGGNTTGQIVLSGRNANATGITFAGYTAGVLQPDANGVISSAALNLAGGSNFVTGTLPVGNGGTGATSFTTNGILFGNNTSALQVTSAAANSVLVTNGSNVPSLSTTLPNAVQDNITRLGTIVSGVWNGTVIGSQYGGTGQNFSGATGVPYISSGTWATEAQLAIARGGTNSTAAPTQGGLAYGTGTAYAFTLAGTSGQCLISAGTGAPVWTDCGSASGDDWDLVAGALYPKNATVDLLIGGTSTASAKFAFINVNSGTPTASIAGNIVLAGGARNIQSTAGNTLTIGGSTTGQVVLSGRNGSATGITLSGYGAGVLQPDANGVLSSTALNLAGGASYVTGVLPIANGGTNGSATPTGGAVAYGTGTAYAFTSAGSTGQCLISGGGSAPTWSDCGAASGDDWDLFNGALYPKNTTVDVLIGGTSTASAKFAFINTNSGTPTASIAGNIVLAGGARSIQGTAGNSLTLGGSTTGQVILSGRNANATGITFAGYTAGVLQPDANGVLSSAALNLAGGASYITGTLPVGNGGTGATSFTANGILFGNGSSAIQVTGAAANSVLVTNGSNVPSLSTTLPNAVQDNITRLGTITSGVWNGTVIGSQYGGTGQNFSGSTGVPYISSGTWATEAQLAIARGGTNSTATPTQGGLAYGTGTAYAFTLAGTSGQCLISAGTGAPAWTDCGAASGDDWNQLAGALYPKNSTVDLLIGGTSTASAKFAVLNMNSGTPVASLSATTTGLALDASGSIQSLRRGTLTLGGSTTGNIVLTPGNGSGTVQVSSLSTGVAQFSSTGILSSSALNLAGGASFITGTLPIANGGTNSTATPTQGGIAYGTGTAYAFSLAGTSGQCLTSAGTGTPVWAECATGANYWTAGAGTLYSSNITRDLLIGGIATSSAKFAVLNMNSGTPVASLSATTTGLAFDASGSIQSLRNGTLTVGGNTTGNIQFIPGNTTAMTLLSNGNVGIGTTTPTQKLEVGGTLSMANNSIVSVDSITINDPGPGEGIVFGNTTATWRMDITPLDRSNADGNLNLYGTADNIALWRPSIWVFDATNYTTATAQSNGGLNFTTTGTGPITFNPGGNIGIGTTTPLGLLNIDGRSTGKALAIFNETGNQDIFTASAAGTPRFSITNAGGIKLGTNEGSASQCLQSGGSAAAAVWGSCGGGNTQWDLINGALAPSYASTVDLLIGGTSTASAKFAVLNMNSGTPVASLSATTTGLALNAAGSIQSLRNGTLTLGGNTTGNIQLAPNGSTTMSLTNGNVGIGVTNPSSRLEVNGTNTGGVEVVMSASSGSLTSISNTVSATANAVDIFGADFQVGAVGGGVAADDMYGLYVNLFTSGGATADTGYGLYIDDMSSNIANPYPIYQAGSNERVYFAGNVGIGVDDTSDHKLQITGTANQRALAAINGDGNQDIFTASRSGVTKFLVDKTGNVGIGTTSPLGILNVKGSSAAAANGGTIAGNLILQSSGTFGMSMGTFDSGTQYGWIQSQFVDSTNTTRPIMLNPNGGNVGIGTTAVTSGYVLDVAGNQIITGTTPKLTIGDGGAEDDILAFDGGTLDYHIGYDHTDALLKFGIGVVPGAGTIANMNLGGNFGIGVTTPLAQLHVSRQLGDFAATGKALAIFNQTESQDILAASASGTTRFRLSNSGIITASGYGVGVAQFDSSGVLSSSALNLAGGSSLITGTLPIGNGGTNATSVGSAGSVAYSSGTAYAFSAVGTSGQCLISGGSGSPTWTDCGSAGGDDWNQLNGTLYPKNSTVDLLIGGTSTASAKFAFTGVNSGSPTASIAGNLSISIPTGSNQNLNFNGFNGSDFLFRTSVGGNAGLTERLRITNAGNIGIGTTAPDSKFQVVQTLTDTSGFLNMGLNQLTTTPGGTSTATTIALWNRNLTGSGTTQDIAEINGIYNEVVHQGQTGSVLSLAIANTSNLKLTNTGTISQGYGNFINTQVTAAGTIAEATGLYVNEPALSGGGAVTTMIGTQIASLANATNNLHLVLGDTIPSGNYGIYNSSTYNNYFAGNVGIGTTTPLGLLNVEGRATGKALAIFNETGNQDIFTASASGVTRFSVANDGDVIMGSSTGTGGDFESYIDVDFVANRNTTSPTGSSRAFAFYTGTGLTNIMTLLNSGNVGIGNTAPLARLQVNGTDAAAKTGTTSLTGFAAMDLLVATGSAGGAVTDSGNGSGQTFIGGAGSLLSLTSGNGGAVSSANGTSGTWTGGAAGQLGLFGGTGGVNTQGNGTGTSIAGLGGKLVLTGGTGGAMAGGAGSGAVATGGAGGAIEISGGTGGASQNSSSGTKTGGAGGSIYLVGGAGGAGTSANGAAGNVLLGIVSDGTARGNIGIGTTSPTELLTIGSSTTNSDRYILLQESGAGSATTGIKLRHGGSGFDIVNDIGTSNFGFMINTSGGTNRFIIKSSTGFVGIGNTTPTALLDFAGSASSSGTMTFRGTTDPSINFLNGENLTFRSSVGGDAGLSTLMTLLNSGNLGIGTTAPQATLEVLGTNDSAGGIRLSSSVLDATNKTGRIKVAHYTNAQAPVTMMLASAQSSTTAINIGGGSGSENAATQIKLYTAANNTTLLGSERLVIQSDGNIGIGEVGVSNSHGLVNIAGKATGKALAILNETGNQNILVASSAGNTRFLIDNNGNVGIGTMRTTASQAAQFRLQVVDTKTATAAAMIYNDAVNNDADGLIIKLGTPTSGFSTAANCGNNGACNEFITFQDGFGRKVGKISAINTSGAALIQYKTSGNDFAEHFNKQNPDEDLPEGTLVCLASDQKVTKCSPANPTIVGVISDRAGFIGGEEGPDAVTVGLLGRIPVFVNQEQGPIKKGDAIGISNEAGVGAKATKPGMIIGRAMEDAIPGQQVMVLISPMYFDPAIYITDMGDVSVVADSGSASGYTVKKGNETIDRKGVFSDVVSGVLEAGVVYSDKIMIGDQNILDIIAQAAGGNATGTGSGMTATESAQINTKFADLTDKLDVVTSKVTNLEAATAQIASETAFLRDVLAHGGGSVLGASDAASLNIENLDVSGNAIVGDNLTVLGRTTLSDVGVTGTLTAGVIGIDGLKGEINTVGEPLKLQSLAAAPVEIMDGKVVIETTGNIITNGAIKAKKLLIDEAVASEKSVGEGTIEAGETTVVIETSAVTSKSKVFLTPTSEIDVPLVISTQSAGDSFTVKISEAQATNTKFNWFIVN